MDPQICHLATLPFAWMDGVNGMDFPTLDRVNELAGVNTETMDGPVFLLQWGLPVVAERGAAPLCFVNTVAVVRGCILLETWR